MQFVHYELTKDRGKKVEHKTVPFVTGFHTLPEQGGVLDQPCWTLHMFEVFRAGENNGSKKLLK